MTSQLQAKHRILLIDDNHSIHDDFRKILCVDDSAIHELEADEISIFGKEQQNKINIQFELDSAYQGMEGLTHVQNALSEGRPYSVAFVDMRMPPGWDGVETIDKIWQIYPDLQVVICTAYSDYSWKEMIHKLGRLDNLVILKKPFDTIEVLQLAHTLSRKWLLSNLEKHQMETLNNMVRQRTTELETANTCLKREIIVRMQAEQALRLSEERFEKAFKTSPIPIAILRLKDTIHIDVNMSFLEMTGYSREAVIGHTTNELDLWHQLDIWNKILLLLREAKSIRNLECQIRTSANKLRDVLLFVEPFNLADEPHLLVIIQDITDRLHLEIELRHKNKMQAIGQLSAGIAHDFNNLLTIIQGHASMYLQANDLDEEIASSMKEISVAADRAAQLTRQLLAFSRKQMIQQKSVDMLELICNTSKIIHRLIGEQIRLELHLPTNLPMVYADPYQMEQVLINLAINSRDAMPKGGTLTFSAKTATIDKDFSSTHFEVNPGHYVCFCVSDTGCGIDPNIQNNIFEPFFTTKEFGKGSGMGLAMVDGIVKQHGGWINVISQINEGATFEVYIPAYSPKNETHIISLDQTVFPPKVLKTVMLVEDEPALLKLTCIILTRQGYRVLSASNGCAALDLWQKHKNEIDLLLTDIVMPEGISGKDLARKLLKEKPSLKVIYSSGYTSEILEHEKEGKHLFLPKPYTTNQLITMVNSCFEKDQVS